MKNKTRTFPLIILAVLLVLMPMSLAFMPAQEAKPVHPFLKDFSAEELLLLFTFSVLAVIQGAFPGASLFSLLKKWLKVEDQQANLMVFTVSMVIAIGALYFTGTFSTSVDFTLEMVLALGSTVYAMSQKGFKWFKAKNVPPLDEWPGLSDMEPPVAEEEEVSPF